MPICAECELDIPDLNNLRRHLVIVHQTNLSLPIKCKERGCFRDLNDWADYRRHMNRVHKPAILNCDPSCNVFGYEPRHADTFAPSLCEESHDETVRDKNVPDVNVGLELHKLLFLFLCKLYASPNLPRSHIQEVFENLEGMFSEVFSLIGQGVQSEISKAGLGQDISDKLLEFLSSWKEPFRTLRSEYCRFKVINKTGFMVPSETFVVGFMAGEKRKQNHLIRDMLPFTAQFVPLRKVLKLIFELPNVLDMTLSHMEQLASDMAVGVISNVIQGQLWQQKIANSFTGKLVLPLCIYYDDFEVNNPLGTHNVIQKLGGVYFNVPCFPPEFRSKIENIFLAVLFHSSDRSIFKNVRVFQKLIDELNFLQTEGIVVRTLTGERTIYFSLAHFLGDNLGLNSAMGFVESFRSHYFCRICKVKKVLTQKDARERPSLVRTPNDYQHDVELGYEETGVKEASVWNKIEHFHTVSNFVVDVFHDLLLGVLNYDLGRILHHFIYSLPKDERLSLDLLNDRLRTFDYVGNGIKNVPPLIADKEMEKKKIRMSASEMLNFVLILPMLIGDKISKQSPQWQLYLINRQILDIVCAKSFQEGVPTYLDTLVEEHHHLYIELFGNLKPKHHFMVHYGRIMRASGPLWILSAMRFESKHRALKQAAIATSSRRNITMTVALKEQLSLCYRLVCQVGFQSRVEHGDMELIDDVTENFDLSDFDNNLPDSFTNNGCISTPWVKKNGITYKHGTCITLKDPSSDMPLFATLQNILIDQQGNVCFVCEKFLTLGFDEEMHCYEVERTGMCKFCTFTDMNSPIVAILVTVWDDCTYVTLPFAM